MKEHEGNDIERRRLIRERGMGMLKSVGEKPQPEKQTTFIAEHTVAEGETLSHLSLKYYGSAVKEKWMVIYEANKDLIGDDPGKIRPGQVLKIPELPK